MRILHVQYTNPGAYPPLVRGAQVLAESGAEVTMLGVRVRGLDALDAPTTPGVDVRLMEAASDGWRLKAHYARYAAWVAREATRLAPDWIYASDLLAAPIALAVAALTAARVVYHEHDAPSLAHESWTIRRCLEARQRLLRQADLVVTPNAERSAHLSAEAGGRDVVTVWNCPRRPTGSSRPRLEQRDNPGSLRVIFRGSINAERLPSTVIEAVARVGDGMRLEIAGYETAGSRGHVDSLMALADRLGVRQSVAYLGTMPDAPLADVCGRSDLGLALMPVESLDENMRHMTGASNKVFEYFSFGVAPLVSDLADWRETFVDPGYALACDPRDADSIARAFTWASEHRETVRAMAARGLDRLCSDWNYESQFEPVLRAMWASRNETTVVARTSAATANVEVPCAS